MSKRNRGKSDDSEDFASESSNDRVVMSNANSQNDSDNENIDASQSNSQREQKPPQLLPSYPTFKRVKGKHVNNMAEDKQM